VTYKIYEGPRRGSGLEAKRACAREEDGCYQLKDASTLFAGRACMVKPRRNLPRSHLEKLFAFCILCDLLITLRLARWFGLYSSSIRARETRENKGATVHEPVRQRLSNNRVCLFLSISMSGGGGGNVRATFRSFRRQDEKRREKAIRSDTVKGEKDFVATVLSSASLLGSRYARFKTKDRRHNAAVA